MVRNFPIVELFAGRVAFLLSRKGFWLDFQRIRLVAESRPLPVIFCRALRLTVRSLVLSLPGAFWAENLLYGLQFVLPTSMSRPSRKVVPIIVDSQQIFGFWPGSDMNPWIPEKRILPNNFVYKVLQWNENIEYTQGLENWKFWTKKFLVKLKKVLNQQNFSWPFNHALCGGYRLGHSVFRWSGPIRSTKLCFPKAILDNPTLSGSLRQAENWNNPKRETSFRQLCLLVTVESTVWTRHTVGKFRQDQPKCIPRNCRNRLSAEKFVRNFDVSSTRGLETSEFHAKRF